MFNLKIGNDDYIVYDKGEQNLFREINGLKLIRVPSHYTLTTIPAQNVMAQISNNTPVIIKTENELVQGEYGSITFNYGTSIKEEDYQILYNEYLEKAKENSDEVYSRNENAINMVNHVKTLRKHK